VDLRLREYAAGFLRGTVLTTSVTAGLEVATKCVYAANVVGVTRQDTDFIISPPNEEVDCVGFAVEAIAGRIGLVIRGGIGGEVGAPIIDDVDNVVVVVTTNPRRMQRIPTSSTV
jgi:hypothetical protein